MIIFNENNITVFQSELFKMNSTVVITKDLVLVVDPGYLPNEINEIRYFVDTIKQDKAVFLFFTHSDFDHIVGNGAFPDAKKIASRQFVNSSLKNKQLKDIISFDDDFYIDREYKTEYPIIDYVINSDGHELKIGETLITFYQAFGHTEDGLFAFIDNNHLLIAGDYLSDVEFPFVYHSFKEYEKTLDSFKRVTRDKSKLILVPGHGSVTKDEQEIQRRINTSSDYFSLIKNEQNDHAFKRFLLEKGYNYRTNLFKRHQENLIGWKDQNINN
jgi:glyoxylase-like metal-dependent hydrolase (beta-lactamase superfamily II)